MSKFPRMYAESTLKRMYAKLGLPEETVSLLHNYFLAFAEFYAILPLNDAFKIIESQNKNLVTEEQFIAFSEIARHEEHFYWILGMNELYTQVPDGFPMEREIILRSLLEYGYDDYYDLSQKQNGKKLYVPKKADLFKYCDAFYVEETPQARAVADFVKAEFKLSPTEVRNLMSDIVMSIRYFDNNGMDNAFNCLEFMNLSFSDDQRLKEFIELYQNLHNNTRIPANRGFTPAELYVPSPPKDISFSPNLRNLLRSGELNAIDIISSVADSDYPDEFKHAIIKEVISAVDGSSDAGKNVGRNDLCPCGSGKKYKKCCGKAW